MIIALYTAFNFIGLLIVLIFTLERRLTEDERDIAADVMHLIERVEKLEYDRTGTK